MNAFAYSKVFEDSNEDILFLDYYRNDRWVDQLMSCRNLISNIGLQENITTNTDTCENT